MPWSRFGVNPGVVPGNDGPTTVPFQPTPVQIIVSRIRIAGDTVTAITRVWEGGDTRRCRLCPGCSADHARGVCQVQTAADVPDELTALFTLVV